MVSAVACLRQAGVVAGVVTTLRVVLSAPMARRASPTHLLSPQMLINNTGGLGMSDALYASERHNARSARNTTQGSAAVWCVSMARDMPLGGRRYGESAYWYGRCCGLSPTGFI